MYLHLQYNTEMTLGVTAVGSSASFALVGWNDLTYLVTGLNASWNQGNKYSKNFLFRTAYTKFNLVTQFWTVFLDNIPVYPWHCNASSFYLHTFTTRCSCNWNSNCSLMCQMRYTQPIVNFPFLPVFLSWTWSRGVVALLNNVRVKDCVHDKHSLMDDYFITLHKRDTGGQIPTEARMWNNLICGLSVPIDRWYELSMAIGVLNGIRLFVLANNPKSSTRRDEMITWHHNIRKLVIRIKLVVSVRIVPPFREQCALCFMRNLPETNDWLLNPGVQIFSNGGTGGTGAHRWKVQIINCEFANSPTLDRG